MDSARCKTIRASGQTSDCENVDTVASWTRSDSPVIEVTAPAIASQFHTTYSVAYSDNVELAYSIAPSGSTSTFPPGSRSAVKNYTATVPLGGKFEGTVMAADTSGNVSKKLVQISTPSVAIPSGTYIPVGNPTTPENFYCLPPGSLSPPNNDGRAIQAVSVGDYPVGYTRWDSTGYFACAVVDIGSQVSFCTSSTVPFSATKFTPAPPNAIGQSGIYEYGFDGEVRLISSRRHVLRSM